MLLKILTSYQRRKLDESDDSLFYSNPKFVYHLDSNFRKYLTNVYKKEIKNNSVVLDLMSSWDSYLPKNLVYKKVIGHGLNHKELDRNKAFDNYWIQNLNFDQNIPLENDSVDCCLIVAGWQYLQQPENVAREIFRVLSADGKILISFSNRAFWHKAPNIWSNSTEDERIEYVKQILLTNQFNEVRVIQNFISKNYPILPFFNHDPFYCVIARKVI